MYIGYATFIRCISEPISHRYSAPASNKIGLSLKWQFLLYVLLLSR